MNDTIMERKLENNPLVYRHKLTIPDNINFGLELELEGINRNKVYKLVRQKIGTEWKIKTAGSLTLNENAEINSPVLQNTKQTWILIKKVGELLKTLNPTYNYCSFQVNFDGSLLPSNEDRVNFLKLYAMYEDIIYKFSKGDDPNYRDSLEMYAYPIILTLKGGMRLDADLILELFSNNKRYGIVFKTENKDLIEFRTPNMTNNITLWQNYITTFYYLIEYASKHKINSKEVDYYLENFQKLYVLEDYEQIKKQKALTFSKKIFKNSIDQYSFMHQYLQTNKCK